MHARHLSIFRQWKWCWIIEDEVDLMTFLYHVVLERGFTIKDSVIYIYMPRRYFHLNHVIYLVLWIDVMYKEVSPSKWIIYMNFSHLKGVDYLFLFFMLFGYLVCDRLMFPLSNSTSFIEFNMPRGNGCNFLRMCWFLDFSREWASMMCLCNCFLLRSWKWKKINLSQYFI